MAQETTTVAEPHLTDAQRDELAEQAVSRYAAYSAAAGIVPVPLVDVLAVGGVQLQMLRKLAQIYGVPFSENRGKSVIASVVGAILATGTGATAAVGLASALKFIPVVGITVGSLTVPAVSSATTFVMGKVFIQHFASGGTLLDFNPGNYREFIKRHMPSSGNKTATGVAESPAASTPSERETPTS